MTTKKKIGLSLFVAFLGAFALMSSSTRAQLPDRTQNPNTARAGINKSLTQQIGAGRGDRITPNSSAFIIARDPFRAIRRGRQLFQRKFLRVQGQGPLAFDAVGDLEANFAIGAGMTDSCAACHGRPRGAAGFGGDVASRPDSRDAPHLFGLGLKEMLADEITADLRAIRNQAIADARAQHRSVTKPLTGKGINYGAITAHEDGSVDTSLVEGVDPDLRVRPFFAHGGTISIREFVIGAFNDEMGLQAVDPDVAKAAAGERVVTPYGMVLDGTADQIKPTPADNAAADPDADGVANEIPSSLVDFIRDTQTSGGTTGISLSANYLSLKVVLDRCQALRTGSTGLIVATSPSAIIRLTVRESQFSGTTFGVKVVPDATGTADVNFDNCTIANNKFGLDVEGAGATARISNSTITDNGAGLMTAGGATLLSRGNNTVEGNSINGNFTGTFLAK